MPTPIQAEGFFWDNSLGSLHFSRAVLAVWWGGHQAQLGLEDPGGFFPSPVTLGSPQAATLALSALCLPLMCLSVPIFEAQGKFLYPFFSCSQFSQPLSAPRLLLQISAITSFLSTPCFSKAPAARLETGMELCSYLQ